MAPAAADSPEHAHTRDHAAPPVAVRGWLHPEAGERVDTRNALSVLRERGLLAAVQQEQPEVDDLCDLTLLLDADGRALVVTGGGVMGGPRLADIAPELAEALSAAIEIDGEFYDVDPLSVEAGTPGGGEGGDARDIVPLPGPAAGEDDDEAYGEETDDDEFHDELFVLGDPEPGVPDVALCRSVASSLPQLAHDVRSALVAGHVDGWTLVRFDEHGVPLNEHGWLPGELPAVQLTRVHEQRFVQVTTSFAALSGLLLTRHADQATTYGPDEVDPELVDTLVDSHLAPDSDLHTLLASKYFRGVDERALAEALQQPMDDRWLTGVLEVLGLPTLAADVLEGRAEVPSPTRVEQRSLLGSLGETMRRYYDAPPEEIARRTPYGRLFASITATPGRVAATVVVESALAVWLLTRSRRHSGRNRLLLRAAGASTALDVVSHLTLSAAKFRRR